ncbi:uncharacterized protein LOC113782081 [Coffea eugenioides]|uniref:uncharacterized protein LOC113782081 n=1 Tax=Coffea eugenioides TaxID=49369 RepID=UPI000F5D19D0|nr:uncharacterized protein LOC113710699 [Coffea arabica]XP_027183793.1 uncharacterized protein LOC113782081 [Coffea eugenioides]
MGRPNRQNRDTAIVGPSIVLLQERFKKLGRIKEKREQMKQTLKMVFSEPQRILQSNCRSYNSFTDHELNLYLPSRPAFDEDPLSLGFTLSNKHAEYGALKKAQPSFSALWSYDERVVNTPQMYDKNSDVDTSLHL